MGLFGKVSGKQVDAYAKELVAKLVAKYPPDFDKDPSHKISGKRLTKHIEDICQQAGEYKQENKLGMFLTARFGNTFRWELKDQGYSDDLVDVVAEGVIVYMTKKK